MVILETSYHARRILRPFIWLLLSLPVVLAVPIFAIYAQDSIPSLTLTNEQELSYRCPMASAVQPDTDILWVLMDNCGGHNLILEPYDRSTGTPLPETASIPLAEELISPAIFTIDRFISPMRFTPDNLLEIIATNFDNETFSRFQVDVNDGTITQDAEADEHLNDLLLRYSPYPVYMTNFRADHQLAAVGDEQSLYVLNVANETVLFEIPDVVVSLAAFSDDGQRLYVNTLTDPDNYESFAGTLSVYTLPDGELLTSLPLDWSGVYPSPDGTLLVVELASAEAGEEQIGVLDLETGVISNLLPVSEAPQPVIACRNDGRSMTDYGYSTSGMLTIRGLHWLDDNSGFATLNSPGYQVDSSNCYWDVSRFRTYSVSPP